MGKGKLKTVIKFIAHNLKDSGIKVSKIVVFGSQVKGKTNRHSDIDLIIISDSFRKKNFSERAKMTMNAEIEAIRKFKVPFDILTMTNKEYNGRDTFMAEAVKEEGKVLYVSH